jgi:O-antigen biosynthesis protein
MLVRLLACVMFFPLQLGVATLFLVAELLRLLALPLRPGLGRDQQTSRRNDLCSIIVLNWDGRHLLEESLPPLLRAVSKTGQSHEILVVDNGSSDGSPDWLAERFPSVRVLALDRNYGFGEGNNRGVRAARHDLVVLVNNDMIVEEDFLDPLLEPFSDPAVFAASSQVFFPADRRREETGNTRGYLSRGYLNLSHEDVHPYHSTRRFLPVLWAGGGSSAFDRARFLALGGFSEIFSPCYFEDTDLSYRAWRRGWKVLLAAESRVLHKHRSSTASRFEAEQLRQLIEQRRLWYLWRNYPLRSILSHLIWLPLHFGEKLLVTDYLGSLRKLPQILITRIGQRLHVFGHDVVCRWISHPLSYLDFFFPDRAQRSRTGRLRILLVSAYLPHLGYHGGAGRVFHLLLRTARHHEVSLLSFVETSKEAEELAQVIPHCKRAEVVLRREYQPVSPFPYEPFEEFNSPHLRERLEQLLTEEDFDLVHFEWTQMAQFADLVSHSPKLLTEIEVNYAAHQSQLRYEADPLTRLRKSTTRFRRCTGKWKCAAASTAS